MKDVGDDVTELPPEPDFELTDEELSWVVAGLILPYPEPPLPEWPRLD